MTSVFSFCSMKDTGLLEKINTANVALMLEISSLFQVS